LIIRIDNNSATYKKLLIAPEMVISHHFWTSHFIKAKGQSQVKVDLRLFTI